MKLGLYPGSFNPWHEGHEDILKKALQIFDQVIVSQMQNLDKIEILHSISVIEALKKLTNKEYKDRILFHEHRGLLVEAVKNTKVNAVIRGLRNGTDLQYEQNMQYWNEDLGLTVPTIYFICDRKLSHISSSAIRMLDRAKYV